MQEAASLGCRRPPGAAPVPCRAAGKLAAPVLAAAAALWLFQRLDERLSGGQTWCLAAEKTPKSPVRS